MISQQFLGFKNLSFVGDTSGFKTDRKPVLHSRNMQLSLPGRDPGYHKFFLALQNSWYVGDELSRFAVVLAPLLPRVLNFRFQFRFNLSFFTIIFWMLRNLFFIL
jgi:hypothetical protein